MKQPTNFRFSLLNFIFFFTLSLSAQNLIVDIGVINSGFNRPVDIKFTDNDHMFVVEQDGIIKIVVNGILQATPFLNIDAKVGSSGNEQGLLGLAFSPNYSTDGRFYVNYTNNSGNTVIARYQVSSNPNVADAGSEEILLTISQPFSNHNGGHLAFGQDGYLYIGTGDGGSGGDPNNNAQNGNSFLGKMLRIDVSGANGYTIPQDNPFINDSSVLSEIWALGLRNPWRFSFDMANGDLWIGDVGQNAIEEIDYLTAGDAGGNLGWRCYEGNSPYNTSGCSGASNYKMPIVQYNQGGSPYRCAITGGYVYRSNEYPALNGYYFFSDYCSGEIMALDTNNGNQMLVSISFGVNISTFGQNPSGDVFCADLSNGSIFKISTNVVNINENNISNAIKIIPNPTHSAFKINLSDNTLLIDNVAIYNTLGKKVFNNNVSEGFNEPISVANLNSGMYFVKIHFNDNSSVIKKLVVQ